MPSRLARRQVMFPFDKPGSIPVGKGLVPRGSFEVLTNLISGWNLKI